jgi:hypothetical protein
MPDYQKAKIYRIISPSKNLVYYGSTAQSISQRLAEHLCNYNKNKGFSSKIVLECEDYKIELVEEYPCNNRQQLLKKEGEYIKNNECCNKIVAGRTYNEYYQDNKEKKHEYYEANKKKITDYHTEYNKKNKEEKKAYNIKYTEANKEKILEQKKQYYLKKKQQQS